MYNIGICDDEKCTCTEIESLILEYGKKNQLQIEVDIWYSGENLCRYLKKRKEYDLIFLDIELLELSGLDVGNYIRNELEDYKTFIVYISSKMNYAMKLFKTQPLDFLVKPIRKMQVDEVLNKAIKIWEKGKEHFNFQIGTRYYKVPYEEIIYFCSMDKKVQIFTMKNSFEFYGKLKIIFSGLPINFMQIHQSYIINQNYISRCTYNLIEMINGEILPISKPYRTVVRKKIKEYQRERDQGNVRYLD